MAGMNAPHSGDLAIIADSIPAFGRPSMFQLTRYALCLCLVLLAGCGFQLRQAAPLPAALSQVQVVQLDPLGLLSRQLERELVQAGARLAESDAATLEVVSERFDRRVLAVDSRARVSEYELELRVAFRLSDAAGKELIAREEFVLTRDYAFDELAAIGASQEEALIREELTRDAARRILQRATGAIQ